MKSIKAIAPYFLVSILSAMLFGIIFQIWNVDLRKPLFGYDSDGLIYIFLSKTMIETGWFMTNPFVGLPHINEVFSIYDFPLEADSFYILIMKFLTYFTSNHFVVINSFFILSFVMISASAFAVLHSFGISIFTACGISILYAFLPYHFVRSTWHIFLTNYMIVPLAVMVGLWIVEGKISIFEINKKNQYAAAANKFFFIALAISVLAAGSDIYYAYYSLIIFIFSWLLYGFKTGKFFGKGGLEPILLCVVTLLCLLYLYLPTLSYHITHGINTGVGGRLSAQSEYYALRIVNLLLPVPNHYVDFLATLRNNFTFKINGDPERSAASLGILGATGFVFLLMWLIAKNFSQKNSFIEQTVKRFSFSEKEQNLVSSLASLNLMSVLFATAGGLVMLISISFPNIRSHARFCVFIAFFAFFLIAIIFDKIIEKKIFGRKFLAETLLAIIMILALFDQVGRVSAESIQNKESLDRFKNDNDFVKKIEENVPAQSHIFVLPVSGFPELDAYEHMVGYINSKHLLWSYPVINGRENHLWQKKVVNMEFSEFIAELKNQGFSGVYINRSLYVDRTSEEDLLKMEKKLKAVAISPALLSQDSRLEFFRIYDQCHPHQKK